MEEQMTYHIVDSIKGGVGKTTFSIIFAGYLFKNVGKDVVCLFDMDFIGTGMWNLFYSDRDGDYLQNLANFKKNYIFVNQKIRNYRAHNKKYIISTGLKGYRYNIAFGSPEQKDKDEYIFAAMQNYTMALQYGSLKAGVCNMLNRRQIYEQVGKNIEHIILDMSPCNDNYSQLIKQILFDRSGNLIVNDKDQINYYLLVGLDQSHVVAAANYLRSFLGQQDKLPDKIVVIFNDVAKYLPYGDPNVNFDGVYQARKEMFCNIMNIAPFISEEKKNTIHFLALHVFNTFDELMLDMKPLTDIKKDILFGEDQDTNILPFSHYADFYGKMSSHVPSQ